MTGWHWNGRQVADGLGINECRRMLNTTFDSTRVQASHIRLSNSSAKFPEVKIGSVASLKIYHLPN